MEEDLPSDDEITMSCVDELINNFDNYQGCFPDNGEDSDLDLENHSHVMSCIGKPKKRRKKASKYKTVPWKDIVGFDEPGDIQVTNNSPIPLFLRTRKITLDNKNQLSCTFLLVLGLVFCFQIFYVLAACKICCCKIQAACIKIG